MIRSRRSIVMALALGACSPSVLTTPSDPILQDQLGSMRDFEAWLGGFETRLADPSPETARDCASEALFVLRNPDLWSAPELAPSLVERERFLQLARWEGLRAVRGLPKDMRALSALSEIDNLAGDREGASWARCQAADVAEQSFSAQTACASALVAAGHRDLAVAAWRRAFPVAERDGERFYVLHELEQEGHGKLLASFPSDVVARYREVVEEQMAPSTPQPAERHDTGPTWPLPRRAVRPEDADPAQPASRLGGDPLQDSR